MLPVVPQRSGQAASVHWPRELVVLVISLGRMGSFCANLATQPFKTSSTERLQPDRIVHGLRTQFQTYSWPTCVANA